MNKYVEPSPQQLLIDAIAANSVTQLKWAIDAGVDVSAVLPAKFRTPLHLASEREKPAMVTALVKAGAVPAWVIKDNWSTGLPQLIVFEDRFSQDAPALLEAWWEADPTMSASFPEEPRVDVVETPLSLLLHGVSEDALYVPLHASQSEARTYAKQTPAHVLHARNNIRKFLDVFLTRPAVWTPESMQRALDSMVGSCDVSILDPGNPGAKLGLRLEEAIRPTELLSRAIALVNAYPDKLERARAWMRRLAPLGAEWADAVTASSASLNKSLEPLHVEFRQLSLEAKLPEASASTLAKPRF